MRHLVSTRPGRSAPTPSRCSTNKPGPRRCDDLFRLIYSVLTLEHALGGGLRKKIPTRLREGLEAEKLDDDGLPIVERNDRPRFESTLPTPLATVDVESNSESPDRDYDDHVNATDSGSENSEDSDSDADILIENDEVCVFHLIFRANLTVFRSPRLSLRKPSHSPHMERQSVVSRSPRSERPNQLKIIQLHQRRPASLYPWYQAHQRKLRWLHCLLGKFHRSAILRHRVT